MGFSLPAVGYSTCFGGVRTLVAAQVPLPLVQGCAAQSQPSALSPGCFRRQLVAEDMG